MFKKLMKHLANNPGLKVMSVLVAVVLWMIVVSYNNPEKTRTFTVPVTVVNEDVLENMGKVYEVVGQSDLATIYVTGKRSSVDNLTADDFSATADLSQIDFKAVGDEKIVPIDVTANRNEKALNITQKSVNMRITIEDLSTEQSYVLCDTQGTPAEGYAIGDITVSPNLIKISGPQSIVSQVSRVAASVNVDGLSADARVNATPILYDEAGNVIESTQLRLSQESVTVNIQILGTKTVPVSCETSGTPAEGYQFVELEYAPESITIKGEAATLNNITEIRIPGEAIDIEGASGDVENSIDISVYLEELGVSLVNPDENKIAVKALIERLETRTIELPISALNIENVPDGYELVLEDATVSIPVQGRTEDLGTLTTDQIQATVNLHNLTAGTHTLTVEVTLEERFQLVGAVTIQGELVEQESEEGTTGDTTGTGTGTTGSGTTGTGTTTGSGTTGSGTTGTTGGTTGGTTDGTEEEN